MEPAYPPLAKAARVQGTVTLKVVISKEGTVTDVKTVSGSPILLSGATNAVKQWQYKPFMVEGKPADVSTVIEVPFSLGISEADYKKEQEASERYFKQEEKCRGLLQQGDYANAEQSCSPFSPRRIIFLPFSWPDPLLDRNILTSAPRGALHLAGFEMRARPR